MNRFTRSMAVLGASIIFATGGSAAFGAVPQNEWVCNEPGYTCANKLYAGLTGYAGYDGPYGYDIDPQGSHIAHNCTSYVAFRIYQLMGYYHAPYNRFGMAADWDVNVKKYEPAAVIGKVPNVGDIAQWNFGHVAWVERVNYTASGAVSSVIISDDNLGLKFTSQRKLYPNQPVGVISWPDNFISLPLYGGGGSGNPYVATLLPLTTP